MSDRMEGLMREFLGWVAERPRTYAEMMSIWRTTCPRHAVWEDAQAEGLVRLERTSSQDAVRLTDRGLARLGQ